MEIVVNLVDHDMVQGASLSSSDYPADVDEFAKAGFTPAASEVGRASEGSRGSCGV